VFYPVNFLFCEVTVLETLSAVFTFNWRNQLSKLLLFTFFFCTKFEMFCHFLSVRVLLVSRGFFPLRNCLRDLSFADCSLFFSAIRISGTGLI
jgi:hypothetical protein